MRRLQRISTAWRALITSFSTAMMDQTQREQLPGVRFGAGVLLRGAERMKVGNGVFIDNRAYLNSSTVNAGRGFIHLGDNVEIGPYCVLWGGGGIEIGNNVHMGAHVHITSQQGHRVPPDQTDPNVPLMIDVAPVRIQDNVLIYSGAIVLPGVTIGHHAAIGAGSVVTHDIPPYALAVGAPASVVRIDQGRRKQATRGVSDIDGINSQQVGESKWLLESSTVGDESAAQDARQKAAGG